MKLDILAFGAHPDDTELSCSATLASHIDRGYKAGVVDFTEGEMSTRGDVPTRRKEARAAAEVLGLEVRDNLGFSDGLFRKDTAHLTKIVEKIRLYQPDIILANAVHDRHPDHGRAGDMVTEACFLAGLRKFETKDADGNLQEAWRPDVVYHYIQSLFIKPDFVVDVSDHWSRKQEALNCFRSQFFDAENDEPETFISTSDFMKLIDSRGREFGYIIGAEFGEGFTVERYVGVENLFDLQ